MSSVRAAAGLVAPVLILAAAPSPGCAAAIELQGDDLALALRAQAQPSTTPRIDSQAEFSATLGGLEAGLQFGLQAGARTAGDLAAASPAPLAPIPVDSWTGRRMGLSLAWKPAPKASLSLSAATQGQEAFYQQVPASWGASNRATAAGRRQLAATATLEPAPRLSLRLGAQSTAETVRSFHPAEPLAPSSTTFDSFTRRTAAGLDWTPVEALSLEAGGAYEEIGVAWAATDAASEAYRYLEPSLSATVTPWAGGRWRFSVARTVSPLNASGFVSFVQAVGRPGDASFQPDHEWRYAASLSQQLAAGAALSVDLTRSDLQSVTELGAVGEGETPMSIGPGERQRVQVSLTAPLAAAGLKGATLTGQGAWTNSRVTDPVTHAQRMASGETPYQAELGLDQTLADGRLSVGLKGQLTGEQQYFEPSRVTVLSPTAGLAAVVTFAPGPYAVRLEAQNLIGGGRAADTAVYRGTRAAGELDHVEQSQTQDRSVRISLARSF